jgi:hypothetical protein
VWKAKLILALAVLVPAVIVCWQIASCELANFELHEDLRDLAPQRSAQIGLTSPSTDEDIRTTVIRYAAEHQIPLDRDQVTVQRTGTAQEPVIFIVVDYRVLVKLPGYSFNLHFTPTSAKGNTAWPIE